MVLLGASDISANLGVRGLGFKNGSGPPSGMPVVGSNFYGFPLSSILPGGRSAFGSITVPLGYDLGYLPTSSYNQQLFPAIGSVSGEMATTSQPSYVSGPGGNTWGYYGGGQLGYNPYVFGRSQRKKKTKKTKRSRRKQKKK